MIVRFLVCKDPFEDVLFVLTGTSSTYRNRFNLQKRLNFTSFINYKHIQPLIAVLVCQNMSIGFVIDDLVVIFKLTLVTFLLLKFVNLPYL